MSKNVEHAEALIKRAAETHDAKDAVQFAQAACNVANALCALKEVVGTTRKEMP